ncbi:MAG TPA: recombinase family protein [Candidatus Wunengus sp. YC60]|uniref:recombinase family protein n=1 Tax=Candidatus Wunengus sp. YC60 TaxID=3367697 RepID=UPI0040282AAE
MENNAPKEKKQLNCAIYTRVSTADGLEQDFTSLDSQRESAESYIASQKNEGWTLLAERYDDAGFTGANTDRPALQKLIADVKEKRIDCVVVYKVDRLSRSLLDFSKLLEFFDQNSVTFVSITQHFNTQSSMGRLTLNILLSFAQFEREIISERTRDKMGAARKKGKWIGGCVPLGYDLNKESRKLIINAEETKLVREIFSLYLKEESIMAVTEIINYRGYVSKSRISHKGKKRGGVKFKSTTVNQILRNVLYIGKVKYRDVIYHGEQERIISDEIFAKAQQLLTTNRRVPENTPQSKKIGLLSQIIRCKACDSAMRITYNIKNKKMRYYHYVCVSASKRGYKSCPTKLLNANLMDNKVTSCLKSIINDPRINSNDWNIMPVEQKNAVMKTIVKEIRYDGASGIMEIQLPNDKTYTFKAPKEELKHLPILPKDRLILAEPQLRQNLLLAHQIQQILSEGRSDNLKQIAGWLNITPQRINQIRNFILLCPKIQEDIFLRDDKAISEIPEYKLRKIIDTMDWQEQQKFWQELLNKSTK